MASFFKDMFNPKPPAQEVEKAQGKCQWRNCLNDGAYSSDDVDQNKRKKSKI